MSAEEQQAEAKKTPWYMTAFKVLFFIIAFLAVIFTVLANISGNSDTFKKAVEDYMGSATGYSAHVGKLNHAALFPNIIFDFEDLELRQKEGDPTPVASVEQIRIKIGFLDIVRGSGRFKDLNIEGLSALPGVILPRAVTLEDFIIVDKDDSTAILKAEGRIGSDPFSAQSDIDVFGKGDKISYGFGGKRHIKFQLGALKASTDIDDGEIENLKLTLNDKDVVTGHLKVSEQRRGYEVKGQLKLAGNGTLIDADLVLSQSSILKGTVSSPAFYVADIGGGSLVQQVLQEVKRVMGTEENTDKDLRLSHNIDVIVKTQALHVGRGSLGPISLPIKVRDGVLNIALSGKFAMGDLSGHVKLDTKEMPAKLDVDASLRDLDYGALQQSINESTEVSGVGDLVIKLKSKGRNSQELAKGLNGQTTFIGGQGKFKSGALNLWGGGLVNAILPDLSAEEALGVNCAIMDLKIEEGIANVNTLFLDGAHVTLAGDGSYNIAEDDLDITLKPKPKEISLGSIATAIKISGPIGNPSIAPSLLDFGAKIGGLLLGAINPAFLALSLADIGLNDKHPCASFIGAPEDSAKTEEAPAE